MCVCVCVDDGLSKFVHDFSSALLVEILESSEELSKEFLEI